MKDNDIKQKLKASQTDYQIKTTSDDILNGYYASQKVEEPKKKSPFIIFACSLSAFAVTASVVAIAIISSKGPGGGQSIEPKMFGKQCQTAFSLFSGMNILDGLNNTSATPLGMKRAIDNTSDTASAFEDAMKTFDPSVEVIESLFDTSINIESTISEGKYVGQFGTYPYRLEVYDYVLYTDIILDDEDDEDEIETTYYGEVVIDKTTSYKVELNTEEELDDEDNEKEIEMKIIYSGNSYIQIEQEIEANERTYKYLVYEGEEEIYEQEISFENKKKKNDSIDVKIIKDEQEYVYDHMLRTNGFIRGDYSKKDIIEGTFEMRQSTSKRVYTNNLGDKVEILL